MSEKVIGLDRKPFVPPAPEPSKDAPFVPNENLVKFAETLLERIKAGDITIVVASCVAAGYPMASIAIPADTKVQDLAVLNLAVDTAKEEVMQRIYDGASYQVPEPEEGDDDYEPEDQGA